MSEINVVPYIDVMLVLLIIFMITAPLLTQGIAVKLPEAAAAPLPPTANEPLVVSIDRDGRLYLNVGDTPEAPIDAATLREKVEIVIRRAPDTPVALKGDQGVALGQAVAAMGVLTQAGVREIGILADPPRADE